MKCGIIIYLYYHVFIIITWKKLYIWYLIGAFCLCSLNFCWGICLILPIFMFSLLSCFAHGSSGSLLMYVWSTWWCLYYTHTSALNFHSTLYCRFPPAIACFCFGLFLTSRFFYSLQSSQCPLLDYYQNKYFTLEIDKILIFIYCYSFSYWYLLKRYCLTLNITTTVVFGHIKFTPVWFTPLFCYMTYILYDSSLTSFKCT